MRTPTAGTTPRSLSAFTGTDATPASARAMRRRRTRRPTPRPPRSAAPAATSPETRAPRRATASSTTRRARRDRGAVPAAERQRLVPGAAHGRLQRRATRRRASLVRSSEELRRPGRRPRPRRGHLPRSGREHSGAASFALKYDATAPSRDRDGVARAERERLVQPRLSPSASRGPTPTRGSPPAPRQDLRRAGHRDALVERRLPGPGRQRRERVARAQVRRHAAAATAGSLRASRTRTAGTTTPLDGQLHRQPTRPSGVDCCEAAKSYSGPDSGSPRSTGTCRTRRATSGADCVRAQVRRHRTDRDRRQPRRQPNADGWYNGSAHGQLRGSDATPGSRRAPRRRTTPGRTTAAASVNGTCLDKAGNAAARSLPLKYDATAPQVTADARRGRRTPTAGTTAPLDGQLRGTDATSGLAACPAPRPTAGRTTPPPRSAAPAATSPATPPPRSRSSTTPPRRRRRRQPTRPAERERLVQPRGRGRLRRHRRDVRPGHVRCREDATRARTARSPQSSEPAGQGGNTGAASLGLKYDATAPQTTATAGRGSPTRTAGTTDAAHGQLRRRGRACRASSPATRPRATAGPDSAARRSPAPAATRPATARPIVRAEVRRDGAPT